MPEPLADKIIQSLQQVAQLYHRLVIVVAPAGSSKTTALREVHERISAAMINVNLELSRRMLDLTERQRSLQLPSLLSEIVGAFEGDVILLDNIEILFNVSLQQDPLRLLLGLSRTKTIVVSWSGEITDEQKLVYAAPDHPEYKRYPLQDFLVVSPDKTT